MLRDGKGGPRVEIPNETLFRLPYPLATRQVSTNFE